jgi:hypothetical protein
MDNVWRLVLRMEAVAGWRLGWVYMRLRVGCCLWIVQVCVVGCWIGGNIK